MHTRGAHMPSAEDKSLVAAPNPRSKTRLPRPRFEDEAEEADAPAATHAGAFDADTDLPGAVLMVPNRNWGFESTTSDDHPGACVHHQQRSRQVILVKGTDAENIRSPRQFYFVAPTPDNGLQKRTGFELVPKYFRLHRIRLFFPERYLGRLDDATLHALCDELARLHPED